MKDFVIEPEKLKQEMVDLGHEFVEFWRGFVEAINTVHEDSVEELSKTWHKYFVDHYKTTQKLIEIKMAVDRIDGKDD